MFRLQQRVSRIHVASGILTANLDIGINSYRDETANPLTILWQFMIVLPSGIALIYSIVIFGQFAYSKRVELNLAIAILILQMIENFSMKRRVFSIRFITLIVL